ncbi:MAG: hypothetical protein MUE85_07430 [Microscillaceae bacterium]|jgi:hypothetical protein|nr:hypothetical protein [Microscillaceae bacterium]
MKTGLTFLMIFIVSSYWFVAKPQSSATVSDSLPNTEASDEKIYSEMVLNIGFANRVVFAGRDFNTDQFSLNGGATYYHKSGFFGGVSAYWYSDSPPRYNLTDLSVGYANEILKNWLVNLSYDYLLFTNIENQPANPLQHNLAIGSSYDFGPVNVGVDYGFLTGGENAHRLSANLGGYIPIYDVWIFDKISFSPNVSLFWGTDNITLSRLPARFQRRISQNGVRLDTDKFGLMNINLAIPIQFKIKRFKLNFTYNYSFPQALFPRLERNLHEIGFFTTSIAYTLGKR